MLSIFILLVLAWVFYIGYTRGIILQSYYVLASLVAMALAAQHYQVLAARLSLWVPYSSAMSGAVTYFYPSSQLFKLDQVFYAALAYLVIYTMVYSLARFVGIFIHLFPRSLFDKRWSRLLSGLLALGVAFFVIEMVLTLLSTVPLALVQEQLNHSSLANFMIKHTPVTSSILRELWVTKIIG